MESPVLEAILEGEAGRAGAALALVVATRGSAPRKPGACLLATASGRVAGTVGGGQLEAKVLAAAARIASEGGSAMVRGEFCGTEVAGAEPICGGEAEVAVLSIRETAPFEAAREALARGDAAIFLFRVGASPSLEALLDSRGAALWARDPGTALAPDEGSLRAARAGALVRSGADLAYDPLLPPERLLILGGGHVGRALAMVAIGLGFRVTVADPRGEFSSAASLPPGVEAIRSSFADAIAAFSPRRFDYAVVVTPGHQGDAESVRALLKYEPKYIGLIGSRRKTRMLLDQLKGEGFDALRVEGICAPIGLDIGAETPEEIAISIAAELVAYRRDGPCLAYLDQERQTRRNRP